MRPRGKPASHSSFPEFNPCGFCQNWGESPSMECDGTAPPPTEGDDWNTAGPVMAPGDGAAAAAAKAAAGMDETSPSSTTSVGPCVKTEERTAERSTPACLVHNL